MEVSYSIQTILYYMILYNTTYRWFEFLFVFYRKARAILLIPHANNWLCSNAFYRKASMVEWTLQRCSLLHKTINSDATRSKWYGMEWENWWFEFGYACRNWLSYFFAYLLSYANIHGLCYYNAQQSYNDILTHAHICVHACSRRDSSQHAKNQHIE